MIRTVPLLLVALLGGCATYNIEPFYDAGAGKEVCCRATVTNSKDIATVNLDVSFAEDTYKVHFTETGVNASAPIAAAAIAASDVSAAVTATAITVGKIVK